ncbi:diguanylate cyclase [Vibrio sinaloensis]|nr:diguanylate cyclase [Vibrio sinaloensis]
MQYMALHDPLTGLSNRTALQEQIAAGIAQSKRTDTSLAVVFLDLDDFKKRSMICMAMRWAISYWNA